MRDVGTKDAARAARRAQDAQGGRGCAHAQRRKTCATITIMLSNFGTIAGRYATPLVVPPAVAILGSGSTAARRRRSDGRHRGAPAHAAVAHVRSSLRHWRRGGTLPRCSDQGSRVARVKILGRAARTHDQPATSADRAIGRAARPAARTPVDVTRFIRAYYRGVWRRGSRCSPPEDLAGAALHHLDLGAKRRAGKPLVRVFNPDPSATASPCPHTLIVMTTEDMPFLVDSMGIVDQPVGARDSFHRAPDAHRAARPQRGCARWARRREACRAYAERVVAALRSRSRHRSAARSRRCANASSRRSTTSAARPPTGSRCAARARTSRANSKRARPDCRATRSSRPKELLEWMEDNHFTFLGYREYRPAPRATPGSARARCLEQDSECCVPAARTDAQAQARRADRRDPRARARPRTCSSSPRRTRSRPCIARPISTTSASRLSTAAGEVSGEQRFIGLWTSIRLQQEPARDPGAAAQGAARDLSFRCLADEPRRQGGAARSRDLSARRALPGARSPDLVRIVRGIVNLYERQQVRLFVRRDAFRRFYSCLVYVPRDRYNTQVRQRIEAIVREDFHGTAIESQVQLSDSVLARLHCWCGPIPHDQHRADTAQDRGAHRRGGAHLGGRHSRTPCSRVTTKRRRCSLFARYASRFPPAYQDDTSARSRSTMLTVLEPLRRGRDGPAA